MKNILVLIACLNFVACVENCTAKLKVPLDTHLFNHIQIEGYTYCELVNRSLNGEERAIILLSKVDIGDAAGYQHGAVLIEIIDLIGEEKYIDYYKNLSIYNRRLIYNLFLPVGLEYTNNKKYEGQKIEVAFPKLSKIQK